MPDRTPRGDDDDAVHDTVTDTGVEGGVDAPNEDLDEGMESPRDESGSEA